MNNSYSSPSINIDSMDNFNPQAIIKHNNLKSLKLSNIKLDDYLVIKELFDNLNLSNIETLDCEFTVDGYDIKVTRIANYIELYIHSAHSQSNIKNFLNNLPTSIDCLYIDCLYINYPIRTPNTLDNSFSNLPFGLKKIEIKYRNYNQLLNDGEIKEMEKDGNFNCLFGAKIPFGCEMIINIVVNNKEIKYKVIYENNLEDEITFVCESGDNNIIVKKIIIKKIDLNLSYICNYNVLRIMSGMSGLSYSS